MQPRDRRSREELRGTRVPEPVLCAFILIPLFSAVTRSVEPCSCLTNSCPAWTLLPDLPAGVGQRTPLCRFADLTSLCPAKLWVPGGVGGGWGVKVWGALLQKGWQLRAQLSPSRGDLLGGRGCEVGQGRAARRNEIDQVFSGLLNWLLGVGSAGHGPATRLTGSWPFSVAPNCPTLCEVLG